MSTATQKAASEIDGQANPDTFRKASGATSQQLPRANTAGSVSHTSKSEAYGQSFPTFVLLVVATSVVMTWLYVNTNGSLLLATLLHWAVNHTAEFLNLPLPPAGSPMEWSGSPEMWLHVALWWIGAAYFLVKLRQFDAEHRPGKPPSR